MTTPPEYPPPMPPMPPPPGMAPVSLPPYASWGQRAVAVIIDGGIGFVISAPGRISGSVGVYAIFSLASLAFMFWNMAKQGTTGQSIGKGVMKIKLISEETGQVVGAGLSIGRYFVHILDAISCFVGYLFPLWDAKRQTFADKILKTVVVAA